MYLVSRWKRAIEPLTGLCLILSLAGLLWASSGRLWASEAHSPVKADASVTQEKPSDKPPAQSAAKSADAEVVALVNGEPVTRVDLQRMLADPTERSQLESEMCQPRQKACRSRAKYGERKLVIKSIPSRRAEPIAMSE